MQAWTLAESAIGPSRSPRFVVISDSASFPRAPSLPLANAYFVIVFGLATLPPTCESLIRADGIVGLLPT